MKRKRRRRQREKGDRGGGGLERHHIYYKEIARTIRDLKFATQRSSVLLMEVG
jgi:hypothetical protein